MKKKLLVLITIVLCQNLLGQKKIYFDKDWKETDIEKAEYYREVKLKDGLYYIADYFISGKKQFEGISSVKSEPLFLEGLAVWYNNDGVLLQKINFKNNILNGDVLSYYSDGTLKSSKKYCEGKLNGLFVEYFPSGEVSAQLNYKEDIKEGVFEKYRSPGKLDYKICYKNGKIDGFYEFYNSNNIVIFKGNAKGNFQEGLCENFFNDGELHNQYTVKDSKLDGLFIEFNKDKDTMTIAHFKDGKALDFKSKSLGTTNGSVFSAKMILDNSIENWIIYRDEKAIVKSFYENGKKTGVWNIYSYDGTRLIQTIDFGKNSTCEDKNLQVVKADLTPIFILSERFNFDSDILDTKDCENAIVKILDKNMRDLHPFYYLKEAKSFAKIDRKNSNVFENIESSKTPQFVLKNKCVQYNDDKNVMICSKEFDKIIYKVVLSEDIEKLKKIKLNINLNKNEIYLFYQQFDSKKYDSDKEKKTNRYYAFSIYRTLKEAFRSKTLDIINIIGVYENQFWNINDFSGLEAYDSLEEEMKNIENN